MVAAPPNPNREVAGDTIIFRDTQVSSRAVYQCNTSNEHGYLLANAFVSVLGECPLHCPAVLPPWGFSRPGQPTFLLQRSARGVEEAWRLKTRFVRREEDLKAPELRVQTLNPLLEVSLGPSFP